MIELGEGQLISLQLPIAVVITIISYQLATMLKVHYMKVVFLGWFAHSALLLFDWIFSFQNFSNPSSLFLIFTQSFCFILAYFIWAERKRFAIVSLAVFFVLLLTALFVIISQDRPFLHMVYLEPINQLLFIISLFGIAFVYWRTSIQVNLKNYLIPIGILVYTVVQILELFNLVYYQPFVLIIVFSVALVAKIVVLFGLISLFTGLMSRLTEKARLSDRLDSILGQTFHELNNPITNISFLTSELLASNFEEENTFRSEKHKLESMEESINRMIAIVHGAQKTYNPTSKIFALDSLSDKSEVVSLNTLTEIAMSSVKNSRHNAVNYNVHYSTGCNLLCHPVEMVQVIVIVLNNSIDSFGKGEGTIDIKTYISRNSQIDKEFVVLEVEDNGPGIPINLIEKVFVEGVSTKSDSGRGFGLWIAKKIVEKNQGIISIESPGESHLGGTKVFIQFPKIKL